MKAVVFFLFCASAHGGIVFHKRGSEACARIVGELDLDPLVYALLPVIETPRLYLIPRVHDKNMVQVYSRSGEGRSGTLQFVEVDNETVHLPLLPFEHRHRGYGTESKYALIRWAFEEHDYQAVTAFVREGNWASEQLHRKLGFQEMSREGITIRFLLTREDFEEAKKSFSPETADRFVPRGDLVAKESYRNMTPPTGEFFDAFNKHFLELGADVPPSFAKQLDRAEFIAESAKRGVRDKALAKMILFHFAKGHWNESRMTDVTELLSYLERVSRQGMGPLAKNEIRKKVFSFLQEVGEKNLAPARKVVVTVRLPPGS